MKEWTQRQIMEALRDIGRHGDGRPAVLTVNDRGGTEGRVHIFFSYSTGPSVTVDAPTIGEAISKALAEAGADKEAA